MQVCEDRQVLTYSHDCSKAGATRQTAKLSEKLVEQDQVYVVQEQPRAEKLVYVQQPQVEYVEQPSAHQRSANLEYVVQEEPTRRYVIQEDSRSEKQYSGEYVEEPRQYSSRYEEEPRSQSYSNY